MVGSSNGGVANVIDLGGLSIIAGSIVTIFGALKIVVNPFVSIMKKNNESIERLNTTLTAVNRDMDESKRDRESIHKILLVHEEILDKHNDDILIHRERIRTLLEKEGKK